ncbi:MAG: PorV/PorQ family protein [Endomicrobiales bacterium]
MRTRLLVSIIACLLLLAQQGFAKGEGTTAASFLKVDVGARPAAMGGTYCAFSGELNNVNYNPAGLADMKLREISFTHNEWVEGMRGEFLAYAHPVADIGVLAASVNYFYMDGLTERDINGDATGKSFGASDGAFTLTAARKLQSGLLGGMNLKLITGSVKDAGASAFALDAGILYKQRNFKAGIALQNAGTALQLGSESFPLPLNLKCGVVYRPLDGLNVALDLNQPLAGAADARLGAEYIVAGMVFLRAGFRPRSDATTGAGISAGFGINYEDLRFDYAFLPYGDLGGAHRLSLNVKLREFVPRKHYRRPYYR